MYTLYCCVSVAVEYGSVVKCELLYRNYRRLFDVRVNYTYVITDTLQLR